MIGIFDSGLGGLTVVRAVRSLLPASNIVFFSDQAHVPYGERTPEELHALLEANLRYLDARDVEAIVMGCNTSCAIADAYGWPSTHAEVFDLIDSATIALQRAGASRIGVIATTATVRSGAYGRRIRNALHASEVWEIPAPALVPLVEAGALTGEVPRAAVAEVCTQLPSGLDAVVLACTHYPILDEHFAASLGPTVARIDPALVQAQRVAVMQARDGALDESGRTHYVTNGDLMMFAANVARITGETSPECSKLGEERSALAF
ncbi:MAG TPA: glutamate racemase [Candidatus Baltobacteraceae bacterium]|nr:glutamate racemase [Candidatus Baltobacteraceae bacterium]